MNRSKLAFPPILLWEIVVLLAGCGGGFATTYAQAVSQSRVDPSYP
jgi:hypothetical protein